MKTKIFAMIALVAILFTSCSTDIADTFYTSHNIESSENGTTELAMSITDKITDLRDYTIVRPYYADKITIDAIDMFQKEIKDKLDVELQIKTDRKFWGEEIPVGTKEILIGETNRPESELDTDMGLLGYAIAFENERLVIGGSNGKALLDAINFYIENYLKDALYYPVTPYVYRKAYELGDSLDMSITVNLTEEQTAKWRAKTDAKIADIRNTPNTEIPAEAKVYYISNSGNDSADGRTPDTAWKSIDKLNTVSLQSGSYVCFERGGLWRGNLLAKAGVTYTAYGEGEKPKLYGSSFNGADKSLWEKTDTENIWQIKMTNKDVGTLVFNNGEACAIKCIIRTEANGETYNNTTGKKFNSYRDLTTDLHFYHDYKGSGILYLYSKQNPGERFSSIEFNEKGHVITVKGNGVTVDNLCIKYTGSHGVGSGSTKNLTVRNCEFGWIGGSIQNEGIYGRNYATRYGNAVEIYGGCDGFKVTDNYIYQVYDAGITQQFKLTNSNEPKYQKNILYARNVIEYCNYSIEYFLGNLSESNPGRIENFHIEDNYMWYAGEGLCTQRPDKKNAAHIQSWTSHNNPATDYVIKNNLMYNSSDMLIRIFSNRKNPDGTDSMPLMSGNQFVGYKGQTFGLLAQGSNTLTLYNLNIIEYLEKNSNGDIFWFYK